MKTFKIQAFKKALKSWVLIIIWQLILSQHIIAQNNINVVNPPHQNLSNLININISNDFDNILLINNGPNSNPQRFQSINNAVIKKKTASPVKKTYVTSNYKPKPKTANTAINKQLPVINRPKPIMKSNKTSQHPPKKAPITIASANNSAIEIQQLIDKPSVNEVKNVLSNPKQLFAKENTIIALPVIQSSNEFNIKSNEGKTLALTSDTNKTNHHVYLSKRKKINHFRYSTNKKITKLFARSKKNKIEIAKCFAWS